MVLFAMQGEKLASGLMDNVAPALLGGFTLVKFKSVEYSHRKPF
jgi:homoserine kinase